MFSFIMPSSSAKMQPKAQTSIGAPYCLSRSIISGARYHLDTTCPVSSFLGSKLLFRDTKNVFAASIIGLFWVDILTSSISEMLNLDLLILWGLFRQLVGIYRCNYEPFDIKLVGYIRALISNFLLLLLTLKCSLILWLCITWTAAAFIRLFGEVLKLYFLTPKIKLYPFGEPSTDSSLTREGLIRLTAYGCK